MLDNRYATFALLTQNKSFTKTAEALFITQPAVSQQIKSLENELQLKLVEYHHPKLKITATGQQLAEFIATTQHQENKLITQLQHPESTSNLKFGVTHSVSIFMAPKFIQQWRNTYDQIQCIVSNTRQILTQIDTGELDFAILEGNFDKANYGNQVIALEDFVAVTRIDSPLAQKGELTLDQLLDQTLLLREAGSGTRSIFSGWASSFNVHKEDFQQVVELGSSAGIINLLQHIGISFMYRSLIEDKIKTGILTPLQVKGLDITRPISLVYAKDSFFEDEYRALF